MKLNQDSKTPNKCPGQDGFSVNSTKHLKIKLFQKFKEMVPNSFFKASITLIPKPKAAQKEKKKKEITNNILNEHDKNILNKVLVY